MAVAPSTPCLVALGLALALTGCGHSATFTTADDRSELTGFYSFAAGERGKLQLYAVKGLSDGSPDWGAGVSFTQAF